MGAQEAIKRLALSNAEAMKRERGRLALPKMPRDDVNKAEWMKNFMAEFYHGHDSGVGQLAVHGPETGYGKY